MGTKNKTEQVWLIILFWSLNILYSARNLIGPSHYTLNSNCCLCKFKLYLFYNDYETSYTTYINHARWHRCLRSDGLRVGGNRSTGGNPPVWLGDRMTISHADDGYWTRVTAVRGERFTTTPARQPSAVCWVSNYDNIWNQSLWFVIPSIISCYCIYTLIRHSWIHYMWTVELWNWWIKLSCYYNRV